MSEIPKDGKCYLAWYHLGHGFICWYDSFGEYRDDVTRWRNDNCHQVIRWMDEEGIWHKVNDGNT